MLSLYSKLPSILSKSRPSFEMNSPSPSVSNVDSSIWCPEEKGVMNQKGPEIDPVSASALADLREALLGSVQLFHRAAYLLIGRSDTSVNEVFARTPESRFIIAKRAGVSLRPNDTGLQSEDGGELYMLVGKKDASLTDAERKSRDSCIAFAPAEGVE